MVVVALALPEAAPVSAGTPPCSARHDNLTRNGSVTDGGYATEYGIVANEWNPFIFGGTPPLYALADNESANGDIPGSSSQYIHGDGVQFDAGINQTIDGITTGSYYQFSVGWAAMLRDIGGGQNKKMDGVIARLVGVDPTGGTDPHSPNVVWGSELWTGSSGQSLNSPTMQLVFAALSDHVTVYVRAYDRGTGASDKVFFDVMCLLPRSDLPTATPAGTATPTASPTDMPRPTSPPVVVIPATRVPTNTKTPVPTATGTPTITNTSTPSMTPTETPKPRRAIPNASPAPVDSQLDVLPLAFFFGSIGLVALSMVGILGLGAFFLWQMRRHRPARARSGRPLPFPPPYDEMDEFNQAIEPRVSPDEELPGDIF